MEEENPFLKLMEAEERVSKGHRVQHVQQAPAQTEEDELPNDVDDFSADMGNLLAAEQKIRESQPNPSTAASFGSAATGLAGSAVSRSAPGVAERMTEAPAGSVREAREMTKPPRRTKKVMSYGDAADIIAGRTSRAAPLETSPLVPSEAQHSRAFEGTMKDQGVTGRASQTTYNLRTQEIAEQAKKQKESMEILRRMGVLTGQGPSQSLTSYGTVASTPAGIVTTAPSATSLVNQEAMKDAANVAKTATSIKNAGRVAGALSGLGMGVGAVGAGLGLYDAYKRQNEGDLHGAIVGGLGTAASLAPLAVGSAGVLPALGAASPLYLMAHDRLNYLKRHPEAHQKPEVVNGMRFGPMGEPYMAD